MKLEDIEANLAALNASAPAVKTKKRPTAARSNGHAGLSKVDEAEVPLSTLGTRPALIASASSAEFQSTPHVQGEPQRQHTTTNGETHLSPEESLAIACARIIAAFDLGARQITVEGLVAGVRAFEQPTKGAVQ